MTFNESCGPVKCLSHVASIYLNQQLLSIELAFCLVLVICQNACLYRAVTN